MNPGPMTIDDQPSLSHAWSVAFDKITAPGVDEIAPLIVTFPHEENEPREHPIQSLIDDALRAQDEFTTRTVANTMFPYTLWNPNQPRARLYERYERAFRLIGRVQQNRNGTYFQRLVAYDGKNGPVNQLEKLLSSFDSGNHRRSALQAGIFDPARDHTKQRQRGFPCLQQVSFAPVGDDELHVNGFYATEYLFEKAYGNYLGLRDLGIFIAHELNRRLTRVTCVAGIALLGDVKKSTARELAAHISEALHPNEAGIIA
jgi:hypothetical protein